MVSMAVAAAKIAVLLAVAALFAAAGADDPQASKEGACWQCYDKCMHKCDGYPDAPVGSANRTQPAAHIAVDDGAAAASIHPINYTDPTTANVHSADDAAAHVADGYDDKGDDEDEDEDTDKDKDKDKDKDDDKKDDDGKKGDDDDDEDEDEDEDEDDDDDDDSRRHSSGKDYFTCKKTCIVDCYKDLPPVCYKMCVSETCLKLPPYKQGDCFKACGHKCFHKHPGPKPGPKPPSPKPPSPKPPSPKPPSPKPPTPPKPTPAPPKKPQPKPPCPPHKPKPKPPKPCPPKKTPPKPKPPCPPAAIKTGNSNN